MKNYRQLANAESGEMVFPKDEHTNRQPTPSASALKARIPVTAYRLSRLYLGMRITTINEKKKEARDLKESKERYVGRRFRGRKEKGEMM